MKSSALGALILAANVAVLGATVFVVRHIPQQQPNVFTFDATKPSTLVAPPSGKADKIAQLIENAPPAESKDSDDHIRDIVRDEIKTNPRFVFQALQDFAEQQKAAQQADIDKATLAVKDEITVDKDYPFAGNKDGAIKVFYYYDANCPYCKRIDPDLGRFLKDNPDVKLVYRELPILGPASTTAAHVGGTLFALYPESYPAFHAEMMANPAHATSDDIEKALRDAVGDEKAAEIISQAFNVKTPGVAADVDKRITATLDTATKAQITGTPFIFTKGSDEFMRGADPALYQTLSDSVAKARKLIK